VVLKAVWGRKQVQIIICKNKGPELVKQISYYPFALIYRALRPLLKAQSHVHGREFIKLVEELIAPQMSVQILEQTAHKNRHASTKFQRSNPKTKTTKMRQQLRHLVPRSHKFQAHFSLSQKETKIMAFRENY
jgi:hypothetical protein